MKIKLLNELEHLESSLFVNHKRIYNKYRKEIMGLWKIAGDLEEHELKTAITCLFILTYRETLKVRKTN